MKKIQMSLKAARVNANYTQQDAADAMHVTRQTIINWESGRTIPGIPEIQMLSKLYNVPQDYIFLPCYSTNSR